MDHVLAEYHKHPQYEQIIIDQQIITTIVYPMLFHKTIWHLLELAWRKSKYTDGIFEWW